MVTPYWPITNGKVERFNRTLGKPIKCAHVQEKNWKDELDKRLLEYHSTPHSVTQCTSCFHTNSKLKSQHSKISNIKTITKQLDGQQ